MQTSADDVLAAHDRVGQAEQELAEAEAALAEAESGTSAPDEPETTETTEPLVPEATVDRVKTAEDDLDSAFAGVSPDTPLSEATEKVNAAAFALQVAWLRLFADAGCLTDEQQASAVDAVAAYTTALQTDLATAGYLDEGGIDGIYGPATVEAVEELQRDNDLPVTGFVDRATAAALDAAVEAAGGEAATQAVADTAALQAALALAGYWTGPIDGQWTDALTAALASLQTDLGVPATGVVDAATLEAMQRAIEEARTPPTTEPPATEPPARDSGDDGSTETTEE